MRVDWAVLLFQAKSPQTSLDCESDSLPATPLPDQDFDALLVEARDALDSAEHHLDAAAEKAGALEQIKAAGAAPRAAEATARAELAKKKAAELAAKAAELAAKADEAKAAHRKLQGTGKSPQRKAFGAEWNKKADKCLQQAVTHAQEDKTIGQGGPVKAISRIEHALDCAAKAREYADKAVKQVEDPTVKQVMEEWKRTVYATSQEAIAKLQAHLATQQAKQAAQLAKQKSSSRKRRASVESDLGLSESESDDEEEEGSKRARTSAVEDQLDSACEGLERAFEPAQRFVKGRLDTTWAKHRADLALERAQSLARRKVTEALAATGQGEVEKACRHFASLLGSLSHDAQALYLCFRGPSSWRGPVAAPAPAPAYDGLPEAMLIRVLEDLAAALGHSDLSRYQSTLIRLFECPCGGQGEGATHGGAVYDFDKSHCSVMTHSGGSSAGGGSLTLSAGCATIHVSSEDQRDVFISLGFRTEGTALSAFGGALRLETDF